MAKRILAFVMICAMMLSIMQLEGFASASDVSYLIEELPEAAAITESTAELRGAIEDIDEALAAENLTSADFAAEVWSKWEAVKEKNAYYQPAYEMMDISGSANGTVYADLGDSLNANDTGYLTVSRWGTGTKYALRKLVIDSLTGADETIYTETGVPFSFPKTQYKAIGANTSNGSSRFDIPSPKSYSNIYFAAVGIDVDETFQIQLSYSDGYMERQSFLLPSGYTKDGNLSVLSPQNQMLRSENGAAFDHGYAKIGVNWFSIPADANRVLEFISFIDVSANADYRVLAVTGSNASQKEQDEISLSEKIYEPVDLSGAANSIAYVDSTNLDKSSMTLTNNDLFDYASYKQYFAISKDGINALAGDDELIHSKQNVPYSFPASQYKAIGLKAGVSDSVSVEANKTCCGISFITAAAVWKDAPAMCRIHYKDGSYIDQSFTAKDGWGTGQSNRESIFAGVNNFAGMSTLALPDAAGRQFGMYEVSLVTDETKPVDRIEFLANGSNYKILAVTLASLAGAAAENTGVAALITGLPDADEITESTIELRKSIEEISENIIYNRLVETDFKPIIWRKWQEVKEKNTYYLPRYETIDISSAALSKAFADEGDPAKTTGRGFDDYFPYYRMENDNTVWKESVAIWKERTVGTVGADEIIYSESGIPFSFPQEQYYAIGTSGSSCSKKLKLNAPKKYHSIAFAAATGNMTSSFEIELQYTEGTCKTETFTVPTGWNSNGNLMTNLGLWADKAAPSYSNSYAVFGINWFEIPVDSDRELKAVVFRDFHSEADYKVLAVTGKVDNSQYEKDAAASEYAKEYTGNEKHINLSSKFNSRVTIDSNGSLDRKSMTLAAEDFFSHGTVNNCVAIDSDAAAAFAGVNNLVTDKSNTTYSTDLSRGISMREGYNTSIEFEPTYAGGISFIAGSASGTSASNSCAEITYEDGEIERVEFAVTSGYSTGDSNREQSDYLCDLKKYLSFGPSNGYTYYSQFPTMGLYSIYIPVNAGKRICSVKFKCSGANKEYKVIALTVKVPDIAELIEQTEAQINSVIGNGEAGMSNFAQFQEINKLIDTLINCGVNINTISGIEQYMQLKQEHLKSFALYISPYGSDENDGQTEESPLKSFAAVKDKIEYIRSSFTDKYPITIYMMPGAYENTVTFSGTWGTEQSPVIIEGQDGAYFTGSRRIDTTEAGEITDPEMKERIPAGNRNNVVEIDLANQGIDISNLTVMDYSLFLNKKRQNVAQYPNGEINYAYSESTVTTGQNGSFIAKDDTVSGWRGVEYGSAYLGGYFYKDYRYDNAILGDVDTALKKLTLASNTTYGVGAGPFRWKAFHIAEELDEPGEWYINAETSKLYYYPPYDISDCTLEIAVCRDALISLADTDYITFRNIRFENSAGVGIFSDRNLGTKRAPSHITVDNCTFSCLESGVNMKMGVDSPTYWAPFGGGDNIVIENNSFLFMEGSAISLYGGDQYLIRMNNSSVSNNYIYAAGVKKREKYAVNLDYTIGTRMKNNVIHKVPAAAVSYTSNDSDISYNEIYNVLRENEDGGALYSGKSFITRGNEISYNYIHDGLPIDASLYNTSNTAIYLDDGLSGQTVHHNIIENFGCGILFSGVDNKISSNTVANSAVLSIMAKDSENAMASTNMRSPVTELYTKSNWTTWKSHYPELELIYNDSSKCTRNELRDNLIDIPLHLKTPFQRTGMNTITDNQIYGYRNNTIFDSNFLLQSNAASEYVTVRNGLLNTNHFDMSRIGLNNMSNHSEIDHSFKLVYPKDGEFVSNPHGQLFMWEEAAGADRYTLELATDLSFQDIVFCTQSMQNRIVVSDFDFGGRNYYWRVKAENTSSSVGSVWLCENTPNRLLSYDIYQLEAIQKQFEISESFNAETMIEENTSAAANTSNRFYEPYVMNKTFFRNLLDQNGQIQLGETSFALKLDGVKTALNNYNTSVTVDLENGRYEYLDFLAGTLGSESDIQLVYENGSTYDCKLDFMATNFGKLHIPNLKLSNGIPNAFESRVLTARALTDNTKVLDKVIIKPAATNAAAINLFAITGTVYGHGVSQAGAYTHLSIENLSSAAKDIVIYQAVFGEDGRLEAIKKLNVSLDGKDVQSVNVETPGNKVIKQFIWNDELIPEAQAWLSE